MSEWEMGDAGWMGGRWVGVGWCHMRRRNLWGVVGELVSGEKGWVSLKGEVGSLPEGGW